MAIPLITLAVALEQDVVAARQRARQISALLGFDPQDQARIATAVSEIARNAHRYAGGGEIHFAIEGERVPQVLAITVKDRGPGIRDLEAVLQGRYRSTTGMGLGLIGARRLMDFCTVESRARGTTVSMKKLLPDDAPLVDAARVAELTRMLAARVPPTALDEVQQQNRELIRTLSALREKQDELLAVNRELEDTNRGVVALYAELAERAESLRRADDTKTRFLSNMSHEFRTPLNSIRALASILLEESDGPLSAEQRTQVEFITRAAGELTDLVNDLLDLAKIEAGKIVVRPVEFPVEELFSTLRGMLRPLLVNERVALHFDPVEHLPRLYTDEGKLSQVLRNFISNALKYTETGEIRVSARLSGEGAEIAFSVADTGIGIAEEDQELIFEEFEQVPNRLQARVKGTGLGLPLSRRLATVLGGRVGVQSELGRGSTFTVTVPIHYAPRPLEALPGAEAPREAGDGIPVLVVEDNPDEQLYYQKILRGSAYTPVQARTLRQAMDALARVRPAAVLLDVRLGSEETWRWLGELKSERAGPAVIVASAVDDARKGYALGADAYVEKPVGRAMLLGTLNRVTGGKVLVIDDDPAARYAIRKLCDAAGLQVLEAADAQEGLRSATLMQPDVIVLDLNLPDRRGEDVLHQLTSDEVTQAIPVVVATGEDLTPARRQALHLRAAAVFGKQDLEPNGFRQLLASLASAGAPRQ